MKAWDNGKFKNNIVFSQIILCIIYKMRVVFSTVEFLKSLMSTGYNANATTMGRGFMSFYQHLRMHQYQSIAH